MKKILLSSFLIIFLKVRFLKQSYVRLEEFKLIAENTTFVILPKVLYCYLCAVYHGNTEYVLCFFSSKQVVNQVNLILTVLSVLWPGYLTNCFMREIIGIY